MPAPTFPIAPSPAPDGSSTFAYNASHVAQGLGRLIDQYRNKPRFRAFLQIYLEEVQELEDAIWSLYAARDPSTLNTSMQDLIGRIVKQARRGLDNAAYSLFLKAKIRVLKSRGTAADLIKIAKLLLGAVPFSYGEEYPAASVIQTLAALTQDPDAIFEMLNAAKLGGVRLFFQWMVSADSFTYGDDFAAVVVDGSSATTGFGNIGLDDVTPDGTGGAFIDMRASQE